MIIILLIIAICVGLTSLTFEKVMLAARETKCIVKPTDSTRYNPCGHREDMMWMQTRTHMSVLRRYHWRRHLCYYFQVHPGWLVFPRKRSVGAECDNLVALIIRQLRRWLWQLRWVALDWVEAGGGAHPATLSSSRMTNGGRVVTPPLQFLAIILKNHNHLPVGHVPMNETRFWTYKSLS
jgi:hypothetical protein